MNYCLLIYLKTLIKWINSMKNYILPKLTQEIENWNGTLPN